MPDINAIAAAAVADYKTTNNIPDTPDDSYDDFNPAPEDTETPESKAEATVEDATLTPETPVAAAKAEETKVIPPVAAVAADEDGLGPKTDKFGRENRLPHSRVTTMVKNAKEATRAAVVKEYEPKLAEVQTLRTQLEGFQGVEALFNDPPSFIAKLRQTPGYAELLNQPAAAVAAETPEEFSEPMPTPNNSPEGLKALLDWSARRGAFLAEQTITKRYKPMEEERQQRERANAAMQAAIPRVKAEIEEARTTWEGFKESEAEIFAELQRDKRIGLHTAWQRVVIPKLKAHKLTEAEMRKKILAEIAAAPTSTSTVPAAAKKVAAVAKSGPRDVADVAREALRSQGLIS